MKDGWGKRRFDEIMTPARVERFGDRTDLPVLSITMRSVIACLSPCDDNIIISIMDEKEGKIFVDRAEKIVQGLTKALARELCTFLQNNLEV